MKHTYCQVIYNIYCPFHSTGLSPLNALSAATEFLSVDFLEESQLKDLKNLRKESPCK